MSDAPPSAGANAETQTQQPGQSILVKRENTINPIAKMPVTGSFTREESGSLGPAMGEIKDIDLDDFIKRLLDAAYAGKVTKSVCLKNAEIVAICARAREVFLSQPALLELDAPVKIVGDVHGQYTDLIRMFEMCGFPPSANFLFLGDYVDRGKQSLETILLLLCYKLKFPENFFLLRGNHECANVTRVYGFYDECKRRCNVKIWKTFVARQPMGRMASAEEMAHILVYMASDESAYATGANFVVDGGITMWRRRRFRPSGCLSAPPSRVHDWRGVAISASPPASVRAKGQQ